ncbi:MULTISPECIES: hypothetical protein [Geobacillus]|uniref:hypothetical protein n=1 Tax=Geobacillus TaxID=129337 RepID=UPI00130ED5FC|nr:hypothetical protein [Geobacillus genomosp. 3]
MADGGRLLRRSLFLAVRRGKRKNSNFRAVMYKTAGGWRKRMKEIVSCIAVFMYNGG